LRISKTEIYHFLEDDIYRKIVELYSSDGNAAH